MQSLAEIFSSGSKFKVLEVLSQHETPLPLRQLAELSEASLTSTKQAVEHLQKLSIIKSRAEGNRRLISLDRHHPFSDLVRRIFQLVREDHDLRRTKGENKRAEKVLEFNTSALEMLKKARKEIE